MSHRNKSHKSDNKCHAKECSVEHRKSFCVPVSFYQELVPNVDDILVPLSTIDSNPNNVKGLLKLAFNENLSRASFVLHVYNATKLDNRVVAAHLHYGNAHENGPVIADLFTGPAQNVNGFLAKGIIDNRDIKLPLGLTEENGRPVNSIAALYQSILDGSVYVNVHTEKYPGGMIRGQIF